MTTAIHKPLSSFPAHNHYLSLEDDGYCGSISYLKDRCELEADHYPQTLHEHQRPYLTYTWKNRPPCHKEQP